MKELTVNGIKFKESEPGDWVVVHKGTKLIEFCQPEGKLGTQQTIFAGTEKECLDYIAENNIIVPPIV